MAEDKVQFEVVTPGKLLVSDSADMVVVPGGEGDFGVLPGHAPMLSTVRPGTVDVYDGDKVWTRFFVAGGFAEVTDERCTVLAEEAIAVNDIVKKEAEERLENALKAEEGADDDARPAAEAERRIAEAMVAAAG